MCRILIQLSVAALLLLAPAASAWAQAAKKNGVTGKAPDLTGKVWGIPTPEEEQKAIELLKAHADKTRELIGNTALQTLETRFFIMVSDLDQAEVAKWQGLLDKMYARLLETFDIPKGTNVWHGKALVYIFKKRTDFAEYEKEVEKIEVTPTIAGICHSQGPYVRIAFFRQPDEMMFATVLVHEASHGFIHRYRSPERIISWVNEGLAEWIAYDLVPKSPAKNSRLTGAKSELTDRKNMGGMMAQEKITGWQYGVAYALTEFMIKQNRRGYVKFFNGLKDKTDLSEAVEKLYGAPLEKVIFAFGKSMGVTGLKP